MHGKYLTGALAIWMACVTGAGAQSAPLITGELTTTVSLDAEQSLLFPLDIPAGTYVTGDLDSGHHTTDFILTSQHDKDIRALRSAKAGKQRFDFIVPKHDGPFTLRAQNHDSQPAQLTLRISRAVAKADQTGAPASPLLSPKMANLAIQLRAGGNTDAFWQSRAREGTPMIEPSETAGHSIVTFLWRVAHKNVRLVGAPAADHDWLTRLDGSDVWYVSYDVPDTLRLAYGMAPDVPQFDGSPRENRMALLASLQADPLNLHPVFPDAPDVWAQKSMLVLKNAPLQPGMQDLPIAQRGTVSSFDFPSEALKNTRRIDIYTPAGFDPEDPDLLVLVLFDGPAYQTAQAPVPQILDQLIDAQDLGPVVAIMIDPLDAETRSRELPPNPQFLHEIADGLLPRVASDLGLTMGPARTVVAGSSYGGLAANWFAHERPDVFGNAISMSGSFQWSPQGYPANGTPYVSHLWMDSAPSDVRLWISAGQYEVSSRAGGMSILETSRHLRDVLLLQNVPVTYREYAGGHDYVVWRGALSEGLLDLFGR